MTHRSSIAALLIDPVYAGARRVRLSLGPDGELQLSELYAHLACDLVERAAFDDHHLIWADENGWDEAVGFTIIDDGANAIAGRFLIVGETDDGDTLDIADDVEPLLDRLTCHRCLFEAEFVTRSGGSDAGFVVQTRLQGVRPRVTKSRPRLVEA
jgi:hypothetical protein